MNFYNWVWLLAVVISILYLFILVGFIIGWKGLPYFKIEQHTFQTRTTVIVPFFNEKETLESCVEGLVKQNIRLPYIEILLVDDKSSDGSETVAKELAKKNDWVHYLFNDTAQKGKKAALNFGITQANGSLIVTIDADCLYQPDWLAGIVACFEQHNPKMVIGPVDLKAGTSLLQKFQAMEFMSLIGSTGGAAGIGRPIMCNGANLAFSKETYLEFDDPLNQKFISGDDVFLMHQVKEKYPDSIHFLKSQAAIVYTNSIKSFREFFKQRFRWTSKMPGYTDGDTLFTAAIVFGIALVLLGSLLIIPVQSIYYKPFLFVYLVKSGIDFWFFWQIADFFKKKSLLVFLPLFEILYAFYVIITAASVLFHKKPQIRQQLES